MTVRIRVGRHGLPCPEPENPPRLLGELIGFVEEIRYTHAQDGKAYYHKFEVAPEMRALPDGSLRIHHPDNKLWGDY
jgi:hypothetical protein